MPPREARPTLGVCDFCKLKMNATGLRAHERACLIARASRVTDFQVAVYAAFLEALAATTNGVMTVSVEEVRAAPLPGYDKPGIRPYIEALRALNGIGLVVVTSGELSGRARAFEAAERTPEVREAEDMLRKAAELARG